MGDGVIGLIGIGRLGSAIAERLLAAGFTVVGFDSDERALASFVAQGGVARTVDEVARTCRYVIACLPNHAVVRDVGSALMSGTILIDLTNAMPAESALAADAFRTRGIRYLDAPVCDWHETVRARGGRVLCGGEADTVAACTAIFAAFAQPFVYTGCSGSGTATKCAEEEARAKSQAPA